MNQGKGKTANRIGLLGCGAWGKYILRDLTTLGCQTWVVARSTTSIENAKKYGATHIVGTTQDIPDNMDGYVIAVPTSVHADCIFQILDRNKPLFVEKPLTDSLEDAEKILSMASDRIFVMDKWRYHPAINALRSLINTGELGELNMIKIRRIGWGNPHEDVDPIWILLPHDLSIALHLLGTMPEITNAIGHDPELPVGISLQLGRHPKTMIEVSSKSIVRERSVSLEFTHGVAMMNDPFSDHVLITHGSGLEDRIGEVEKKTVSTEMPLLLELKAFVDYLNGGPEPNSNATESVQIVKTITRARQLAGL